MGCSASRPDILIGKAVEGSSSASSFFSTASHSPGDFKSAPSTPSAAPKSRFIPAPLVHHPAMRKGDSHHLVSLTSTTYGSLIIVDRPPPSSSVGEVPDPTDQSPSPDSVINTWELMEGLEDEGSGSGSGSDLDFHRGNNPNSVFGSGRSIDDGRRNPNLKDDYLGGGGSSVSANSSKHLLSDTDTYVFVEKPREIASDEMGFKLSNGSSSKPLWKHLSEESLLSKLDPIVASSYEQALSSKQAGIVRPVTSYTRSVGSSPLCLKPNGSAAPALPTLSCNDDDDSDCKLQNSNDRCSKITPPVKEQQSKCEIPVGDEKILLYLTSLRGIRRTYEDCCEVRMIFRAFKVAVDERDVSMDSKYREELRDALGGKPMGLPRVFIRGEYIGGVDEIKQLNEDGELAKMLTGFPVIKDHGFVCESCGDARFVPCGNCNGSRKVFDEEEDRMRRCIDCNENGLIRCPGCCL